jgi:hypothetical protein
MSLPFTPRSTPPFRFDLVLAGLLAGIALWALVAVAVMTSMAPLAAILPPPGQSSRAGCGPSPGSSPALACASEPTGGRPPKSAVVVDSR